jgi:hypothetical protein
MGFFVISEMIKKKKETALRKIKNEIVQVEKQMNELLISKKNIETEIRRKNDQVSRIEKEYGKDISEFPLDLRERLEKAIKDKKVKENALYGTRNGKVIGLTWKHDMLHQDYKKIAIGNDKLNRELKEKDNISKLDELTEKIKNKLKEKNIKINKKIKFVDLELNVLDTYTDLIETNYHEDNKEELLERAIDETLKEKNKIDLEMGSKPTETELTIKKEMDTIILEINNMGVKVRSVKSFLQTKLKELWENYKIPQSGTASGLLLKEFARKYFWEYGIKEINRYKDFESFYKNIFLK